MIKWVRKKEYNLEREEKKHTSRKEEEKNKPEKYGSLFDGKLYGIIVFGQKLVFRSDIKAKVQTRLGTKLSFCDFCLFVHRHGIFTQTQCKLSILIYCLDC